MAKEGTKVVVVAPGEYEEAVGEVVEEGEDAEGNAVVIVKIQDARSGAEVHAGFSPDEIEED